jgi:AraC-like DNA-binding protein
MQEDSDPTDVFIKNLYQVFEENYQSETLDLNQICRLLHISKTQLYRKLSSVSDQSAVELLKDFRLEKAMSLLKNNPEINTKQVAYLVGFRERSHFSNIFSKKYNISPSEVRKKST